MKLRVKSRPRIAEVESIKGLSSRELAEHCPDQHKVFPSRPCTYADCRYAIKSTHYMNCTFVAAEAASRATEGTPTGLSLEEIAETMSLTREGVRLIELRAIKKMEKALSKDKNGTALRQPNVVAGPGCNAAHDIDAEREDEGDVVFIARDRVVAQR